MSSHSLPGIDELSGDNYQKQTSQKCTLPSLRTLLDIVDIDLVIADVALLFAHFVKCVKYEVGQTDYSEVSFLTYLSNVCCSCVHGLLLLERVLVQCFFSNIL